MNSSSYYGLPRTDKERTDLYAVLSECFDAPIERMAEREPIVGLDNIRVLSDGNTVEGGLWVIPMGQYFGGRSVPMTGIAAVGVPPQGRGRGAAHRLMSEMLREQRANGVPLSTLYPATHTLYRKSGYELAGQWCKHTARVRDLSLRQRGFDVRPLTEEADHAEIARVYAAMAENLPGYLDRGSYIWERIYRPFEETARSYGVFRDGVMEGYVFFVSRKVNHGYDLFLPDVAFTTPEAGIRIISLIGDHASMCPKVSWTSGPVDPFSYILPEKVIDTSLNYHWMLRITHLEKALEARGYPAGLTAELHLDVKDDVIPENQGRFVLTVSDGAGSVKPGGKGDLAVDIRGMTTLYSGFGTTWSARLRGHLHGDPAAARTADGVFAGPAPGIADMF